jgi:nuclear pore complex protein Nup188
MQGSTLCTLFNRIISQVYGIDAANSPDNRLTGMIAPSADSILQLFLLPSGEGGSPVEALFYPCHIFCEMLEANGNGLGRRLMLKAESWCRGAIELAETVVNIRTIVRFELYFLRAHPSPDSLDFELAIFRRLRIFNSLLCHRPPLQQPILGLIRTLLTSPRAENREQPSILAHLGGDENIHLLLITELTTSPFTNPETRVAVWQYLSSVVAGQQQGLSILLLFGSEIGEKTLNKPAVVEDKEETATLLRKAVSLVIENDLKFPDIHDQQVFRIFCLHPMTDSDSIVEFLSKTHNSWAPILSTLRQDKALWSKLLVLLAWSGLVVDASDSDDKTLQNCWRLRGAAAAVDMIAVEIYHASNIANAASIEVLRDHFVTKRDIKLQDISSEAFRVWGYRDSLFFHLRRNFQTKFPAADILRLQRSSIYGKRFGDSYFFDINSGRALLGDDAAWGGFEKEIRLANLNMSIVDAQLVCRSSAMLTLGTSCSMAAFCARMG